MPAALAFTTARAVPSVLPSSTKIVSNARRPLNAA
jgi:hypothetical protein